MQTDCKSKIAILIDAENLLPTFADQVFSYAASLGTVTRKEIYGASIALNDWSEPILKYAMHMNLTIRPTRFKNSSDIALAVGAMDILIAHTAALITAAMTDTSLLRPAMESFGMESIDTIIIASSDSDFSVLSLRLRKSGINVIGMGEEKSNPMWRAACSSFITLSMDRQPDAKLLTNRATTIQPAASRLVHHKGPEQERANDKARRAQEKTMKIAPTHTGRIHIIRTFIAEELSARGGKIKSSELFELLNKLPDYQFDQQRSNRKPLDYLTRQFGDVFKFSMEADGEVWIYDTAAGQKSDQDDSAHAQLTRKMDASDTEPIQREDMAENETTAPDPTALLTEAGIPTEDAEKIVDICNGSSSLRIVYNKLRSTFGNDNGRKYYQMVKDNTIEAK